MAVRRGRLIGRVRSSIIVYYFSQYMMAYRPVPFQTVIRFGAYAGPSSITVILLKEKYETVSMIRLNNICTNDTPNPLVLRVSAL